MPTADNFIVAIELGSANVTAIVGNKQSDGTIIIHALAQERSESFIRKGRINNFTKLTSCLEGMKRKLEEQLPGKTITGAYVGIGGMGMHTVGNTVTRHLSDKVLITPEIVRNVVDSNMSLPAGDREILEVVPQYYKLGTQEVADPEGIAAESIEGHFLNIVASASLRQDVAKCFAAAGIKVLGMPISVLTLADAILTEPEKRSGCVFVDMGAETTSVAIYKNNILRHLAVIPLGGASINRDLCTLQIEDSEAEALKRKFAVAVYEENEAEHAPITLSDGRSVKYETFSSLVQARLEEIILNVNHQITLSPYDRTQLIAGLIVTGGAAQMKDMDKAYTQFTGFDRLRLVRSIRLQYKFDDEILTGALNGDGSCNAAIAIVDKGTTNCCSDVAATPEPEPVQEVTATDAPAGTGVATAGTPIVNDTPEEEVASVAVEQEPGRNPAPRRGGFGSAFKSFFKKLANSASSMVNEDEERFPGTKRKN